MFKQETAIRDKQLQELSKLDAKELTAKIKAMEDENKVLTEKNVKKINQLKAEYAIERVLSKGGRETLNKQSLYFI